MAQPNVPDFISLLRHVPDLDIEYAIRQISGSALLFEETIRTIIRLLPSNLKDLDGYIAANLDLFRVKIHGTKSMFRQIGSPNLAKFAEDLERAAASGEDLYCTAHYRIFREKAILFYEQIIALEAKAYPEEQTPFQGKSSHLPESNPNDFLAPLEQAKAAAEDYDSFSAIEALLPLMELHFPGSVDSLLSKAVHMLEQYKPRQALEYIDQILGCSR